MASISNQPQWIIDGNFSRTLEIRLPSADTVFFFDFPRRINLYRAIKRRFIYRGKNRPDLNPGCREKLDPEFILGIWNFRKKKRGLILQTLNENTGEIRVVTFQTPKTVKKFLDEIKKEGRP